MKVKHKCQELLYVHSPHSGLSLNAKPPGKVSLCVAKLVCVLRYNTDSSSMSIISEITIKAVYFVAELRGANMVTHRCEKI